MCKINQRFNRITKRLVCLALAGVMAAALPGCGKNTTEAEETSTSRAPIDKRKTARNLVKQAEEGAVTDDGGNAKLGDYTTDDAATQDGQAAGMKEYDQFKTKLASDNKLLSVEVDAPVMVPESSAYPILSVSRGTVDDTLLKKVKEKLLGDAKLYDGVRLYSTWVEDTLAKGETPDPEDDHSGQVSYAEITKYPIETGLFRVKDKEKEYSDVGKYSSYYMSLIPEGELFYGVTDGKDGCYANLSVTNSDRYGSSLKFFKSRDYNVDSGLVLPGVNIYSWPVDQGKDYIYNEEKNPVPPVGVPSKMEKQEMADGEIQWVGNGQKDPDFTGFSVVESSKETNHLSKEEALRQAEDLLKSVGLTGELVPTLVQDEYITDVNRLSDEKDAAGKYGYEFLAGRAWHIVFQRSINGNVLEDYGEKYTYKGGKQVWFGENIEVFVNDNGIVGLAISDPLKVEETVVENGKLLDFEEIKKIYEKSQLEALNTSVMFDSILSLSEEEAKQQDRMAYSIKIDKIELRYARVTEQSEFERALLVPVWSFSGTCYDRDGKLATEGSFLQINAVDGSVYDAAIGN